MMTYFANLHSAKFFAIGAHSAIGQVRKYTGEPYYVHPFAVCEIVRNVTNDDHAAIAAVLHDVVEDTKVTIQQIEKLFGPTVAQLVSEVTNISRPGDGVRAVRNKIDIAHSANASPLGQTIKLADVIDNTRNIVSLDPKFAAIYLEEKRLLLEALHKGSAVLHRQATSQINLGLAQLKEIS